MLKKFGHWIWLLLIFVVGCLSYVFLKRNPFRLVKEEARALKLLSKTQPMIDEKKYIDAANVIKDEYSDKIRKLDAEQLAMVEHLESDPERLASFLASLHLY